LLYRSGVTIFVLYASLTAVEKEIAGKNTMALMLFFVMVMAIVMMCASVKQSFTRKKTMDFMDFLIMLMSICVMQIWMNMLVMTAAIFMMVMMALLDGFLDFLQKIEHHVPLLLQKIYVLKDKRIQNHKHEY
jgi:TctA family transporter